MKKPAKSYHTGTVKKAIIIKVTKDEVWKKISNIISLPEWVVDVKKTVFRSKVKRGVGAIRKLTMSDGNVIEEHITTWNKGKSLTYVATEGLPFRVYIATISLEVKGKNKTKITWQSYLNSKKMTKNQFLEFLAFMGTFYETSLDNLKKKLEN